MHSNDILRVLKHQRDNNVDGSVYKLLQCDFAYNSNHMEGSKLSQEQTRMIFDTGNITGTRVPIDDILEARNHFMAFDYLLDHIEEPLTDDFLFTLQSILKDGTSDSRNPVMSIGSYKIAENIIGDFVITASPDEVPAKMHALMDAFNGKNQRTFDDLLDFHVKFEKIHPFSDGNGRVGRLVLFKECLANDILPFVITDDLKPYYIRGLQNWPSEKGFLRDTCLMAQDIFEARYVPLTESYLTALNKTASLEAAKRGFAEISRDAQHSEKLEEKER